MPTRTPTPTSSSSSSSSTSSRSSNSGSGSGNFGTVEQRRPSEGMPFGHEDPKQRQRLLVGGIGAVALGVALVMLFVFRPWQPASPTLSGEPTKLSAFVAAPDFHKLSFEKREVYMKMTHAKKDQIAKAYGEGKLSVDEYQSALLASRLGKRLEDMRSYFGKPVGTARTKFIDKLLDKKDKKEKTVKGDAAAKEVEDEQDILKDDAAEKAEIASWPNDVQAQFNEYLGALSDRKAARKAAHKATQPSTKQVSP